MTDDQSAEVTSKKTLSVGKILASARTEQGMSTDMVAARLCLTESYIKSLEEDRYENLPGDTFIRGYLRNYADMVGLNDEEVVRLYLEQKSINEGLDAERNKAANKGIRSSTNPFVLGGLLVVVIAVAAFAVFSQDQGTHQSSEDLNQVDVSSNTIESDDDSAPELLVSEGTESEGLGSEITTEVSNESTDAVVGLFSQDAVLSEDTLVGSEAAVVTLTESELDAETVDAQVEVVSETVLSIPENNPIASLSKDTLNFSFNGDCWYQVIDATGSKLAERSKLAGDKSEIEGVPPFTVTIGDTTVVELTHNGDVVDLSPYYQRKTARFKLGD